MNHISRNPNDLVRLHRDAVVRTLTELLGTQEVRGAPTSETVERIYSSLNPADHEMLLHQEPFDTACDIADIDLDRRQAVYDHIRQPYTAMMEELDDIADAIEAQSAAENRTAPLAS